MPRSIAEIQMFGITPEQKKNGHPNYWKLKKIMAKKWERDRRVREHRRSHNEIFIMEEVCRDML